MEMYCPNIAEPNGKSQKDYHIEVDVCMYQQGVWEGAVFS